MADVSPIISDEAHVWDTASAGCRMWVFMLRLYFNNSRDMPVFAFSALTLFVGHQEQRTWKIERWGALAWLSVWSKVQMICISSSWCHCHPTISCFTKIQTGLTSASLTQVVLEKNRFLKPLSVSWYSSTSYLPGAAAPAAESVCASPHSLCRKKAKIISTVFCPLIPHYQTAIDLTERPNNHGLPLASQADSIDEFRGT